MCVNFFNAQGVFVHFFFGVYGGIWVIFLVLRVYFWSFLGFRGTLVLFKVLGYFGHLLA